jgi:hypothetical protein
MSNMPLYFMIFLATLAASLLLYLGAIASVAITRRPPPLFIRGVAASRLQATGVALLWSGVGVGWLLVWTLALWSAPARISRRSLWGIATLCILSIVSTPWAAGAQDEMQAHGYTEQAYQQLQTSHLVRTLAGTIAALWALAEGWRLPKLEVSEEKS